MFKKCNVRHAAARRRRGAQEEEESDRNDESEDESLLQTIENTKRKRQLLTEVQFKRGTDASQLSAARNLGGKETSEEVTTELPSTMSVSQAAVLEQKQKKAMEEFIQQKMAAKTTETAVLEPTSASKPFSERDLYQQLAAESKALQRSDAAPGAVVDAGSDQAVMLHGTGIAEVILPVQVRAEQASALARAAEDAKKSSQRVRASPRPSVPNRFAGVRPPVAKAPSAGTVEPAATLELDGDRPGFESLRQRPAPKRKMMPSDRASDDQMFKRFVTHQREHKR